MRKIAETILSLLKKEKWKYLCCVFMNFSTLILQRSAPCLMFLSMKEIEVTSYWLTLLNSLMETHTWHKISPLNHTYYWLTLLHNLMETHTWHKSPPESESQIRWLHIFFSFVFSVLLFCIKMLLIIWLKLHFHDLAI